MSGLTVFCVLLLLAVVVFLFKLRVLLKKLFLPFSATKWDNSPKDVLILHCFTRGKCIPNPSPFVLKLETYLRMTNIPYQIDTEDPLGPKGKSPWITLNGTHIADSQLAIEFLNKKYEKDLSGNFTKDQKALARTIRVMMEEHAFWGLAHWRWIGGIKHAKNIMHIPPLVLSIMAFVMGRRVKKAIWVQGLGRHTMETMVQMVSDDLRNLSVLLGNKKFLLGDEPCEEDAAIFGMLAQILYAAFESPYEKLLQDELPNLKEYCLRMREKYWSDWDKLCPGNTKGIPK